MDGSDARPTVISPTAAAPAAQTTLPPPPFYPARRQNAQQQSPGVSAAFGGRAFGGALTLASAGEYGDKGARMIDTLRADQARLVAEIAQLKTENLRLLASAPAAAVGGSSSAAAHAAGATAPIDTLDAEVHSYIVSLSDYIAAMGPIRQQRHFQLQYGSGGGSSSRGGGAGGGGASSSSSSSAHGEPQVPETSWRILTPALRALAERERLLLACEPISLFRGVHPEEEADIHPSMLRAPPQMRGEEDDSDGAEAQKDMAALRGREQRDRVRADHFKTRNAFHSDVAVVIRALGLAGSLTSLVAGHANWRYRDDPPSTRPTRSFTSLPQIADRRYASGTEDGSGRGYGKRTGSSIMVTFEEGDGLLVGVNMNHERLFPRAPLTHIRDHEFVFIGPFINLDAVRVMRWHPQYQGQMGGNRYGLC